MNSNDPFGEAMLKLASAIQHISVGAKSHEFAQRAEALFRGAKLIEEFAALRNNIAAEIERLNRIQQAHEWVKEHMPKSVSTFGGRDGVFGWTGSPFNAHRISEIDKATAPIKAELMFIRKHFEQMGSVLIDLAREIDKITTVDQRLELLNCNRADRALIDSTDAGMVMLMAAYCVEDSAQHRRDRSNDRPLHSAVNAEMQRVMLETPEGRAASDQMFSKLFAPGGLFEAVPRLYRQSDGTILRQGPALTVHDATGSRIVERRPA